MLILSFALSSGFMPSVHLIESRLYFIEWRDIVIVTLCLDSESKLLSLKPGFPNSSLVTLGHGLFFLLIGRN